MILVTGFEPFNGSPINPSAELLPHLAADSPPGVDVQTLRLPVAFGAAPARLVAALRELRPTWCVMLGEARNRTAISIERVGVNLADYRIPDNAGAQPIDMPVVPGAPDAYFATLPVRTLLDAVINADVPGELSLSAGGYVCNTLLYSALHCCAAEPLPTRCGFVHLPGLPEQFGPDEAGKGMPLAQQLLGVRAILHTLITLA